MWSPHDASLHGHIQIFTKQPMVQDDAQRCLVTGPVAGLLRVSMHLLHPSHGQAPQLVPLLVLLAVLLSLGLLLLLRALLVVVLLLVLLMWWQ